MASLKQNNDDDSTILCQILYGHVIFEVGRTAIKLGVFDTLAEGGATCQQLAKKCNVPETNFAKLLDSLCALKLLRKRSEIYENTEVAQKYLVTSNPRSITGTVETYYAIKDIINKIPESVQKGHSENSKEVNLYERMEKDDRVRELFHIHLEADTKANTPLLKYIDFSKFNTLVDLGGSTGTMARKLASMYPKLEVMVFDLPKVIELAHTRPDNKNTRVKFVAGDFFKEPLPKADIYTVCHVLIAFSDDQCEVILRNVSENLKPGGALLIMDYVLNEDRVGPLCANLTQVILFNSIDGKHRTFAEFSKLLERNGFGEIQLFRCDDFSIYDAIFAKKL